MTEIKWFLVYNQVVEETPNVKGGLEEITISLLAGTEGEAIEEAKKRWEVIQELAREDEQRREENGWRNMPNSLFYGKKPDPRVIKIVHLE